MELSSVQMCWQQKWSVPPAIRLKLKFRSQPHARNGPPTHATSRNRQTSHFENNRRNSWQKGYYIILYYIEGYVSNKLGITKCPN